MKSLGYYPGCSLSGTAAEYDKSLRAAAVTMGIELQEVPEWICCGASSAHAVDHEAALCMAADTLAKAKRGGIDRVLAPCAMCYQRLASVSHEMKQQPGLAKRLAEALGESAELGMDQVRPMSILDLMAETSDDEIKGWVKKPLTGLKVACYYGCLLVRPAKITGATEVESPQSMERVLRLIGAEPVRWSMAMECCGASFGVARTRVVIRQGGRVFNAAKSAGADLFCLACPMCHANLDMRQSTYGDGTAIPVLYLTQLLGLAFGLPETALGLEGHFVPTKAALAKIKQAAAAV